MPGKKTILALKPFLETVRDHCEMLSDAELCDFICKIAQEAPPDERSLFLEKLRSHSGKKTMTIREVEDNLISRINSLKEEILERLEAIEDGSYYEEYEDDYYGGYEGPESISEEQKSDLKTLFAETDHLFLSNELKDAEKAYCLLLDIFRSRPEDAEFLFDLSYYDLGLNWRETRARYCRCVYDNADSKDRVPKMLHAMETGVDMFDDHYAPSEEKYPFLQDVSDAKTGEMKAWKTFLKAWKRALGKEHGNRAFILFLEAVHWLDGVAGVATEVRKKKHHMGYLFWINKLCFDKKWNTMADVAQEALEKLSNGGLRSQAAEMLSQAGAELKNDALILKGRREQFCSVPDDFELVQLIEEAERQNVKREELENALKLMGRKNEVAKSRLKILLMLGHLEKAHKIVENDKPLGWSGTKGTGLFFGTLLTALTHAEPKAASIQALLRRYVENRYSYYSYYSDNSGKNEMYDKIFQEITEGVRHLSIKKAQKKKWFVFAEDLGGKRIDAIVSNQHRKAYARAAEVLGALMEAFLLNDDTSKAKELLDIYRNQKYSRHSAFRRELNTVLTNSELLRPLRPRK